MLDYRVFTFLTLYREMNYRRTAELLNMTQPGVTQHIQALEKRYGVPLFRYQGRTLERTGAAEILKRHLDSVMAEEKALKEEFDRELHRKGVVLSVGATKTIGEFVLPPAVARFLEDPDHSLNFVIDNTRNLLAMLERNELDFAVIEGIVDKSRYAARLFRRERFVGVCSKRHRFAGQGKKIPLSEVFQETLLVREKGSGTRLLLEHAIADHGYTLDRFRRTVSLSHFSVIMDLLSRGDAVTFAYETIARQREDLTSFEVENMEMAGEFNFVSCNQAIASEKLNLFFGGALP